jgi:hypothetical protein
VLVLGIGVPLLGRYGSIGMATGWLAAQTIIALVLCVGTIRSSSGLTGRWWRRHGSGGSQGSWSKVMAALRSTAGASRPEVPEQISAGQLPPERP